MGHRTLIAFGIAFATLIGLTGPLASTGAAMPQALGVTLTPNAPPGQPVGITIVWTATATGATSPIYQFSVGPSGGPLAMVQDFSSQNSFQWTPLADQPYVIQVVLRNGFGSTASATTQTSYTPTSLVTGGSPIITPTWNPLVALYSAPPCPSGQQLQVAFAPQGSTSWQYTSWQPCTSGVSVNVYVAGMLANTTYVLQQQINTGSSLVVGPALTWQTGAAPTGLSATRISRPVTGQTDTAQGVLWQSIQAADPIATDLNANLIWYYDVTRLTGEYGAFAPHIVPGGTVLFLGTSTSGVGNIALETDLAGNILHETNYQRVNEQLQTLGVPHQITGFSHELTRLPNGQTILLGYEERLYSNVQGITGPVDILGNMAIALDGNWQVLWSWSAFDFLDVNRTAILGQTCPGGPNQDQAGGCPPLTLASTANYWTYANSISYSPSDHNIIVSLRNQDWIVKIDYRDATGTGAVLWRLGNQGDFTMESSVPYPWFSHQHDATYATPNQVTVFDNGTTRCTFAPPPCDSRGQALLIDETNMTATLTMNVDVGFPSSASGSSELLSNGNYQFATGGFGSPPVIWSDEFLPNGTLNYAQQTTGLVYRTYRMSSLYSQTPPPPVTYSTPTPTSSATSTSTATPSPTSTPTNSDTPTPTSTSTATPSPTGTSTSTPTPTPDLIEVNLTNPPATLIPGASFRVADATENLGQAAAGPSTTRYYLSPYRVQTSGTVLLTGTRSVPALGPTQTSTGSVLVTVPSSMAPGTYYLAACADDLNMVPESNKTNNCRVASTTTIVTAATSTPTASPTPSQMSGVLASGLD